MARIGNEAKLILKLVGERMSTLRDSRVQTPDDNWRKGYDRCMDDWNNTMANVVKEVEEK